MCASFLTWTFFSNDRNTRQATPFSVIKNVVIIGGGSVGTPTAKQLSQYHAILVAPRSAFLHLPAMVRTTTTSIGQLEDRALWKLARENKYGTVVSFTASPVSGEEDAKEDSTGGAAQRGEVTLDSGEVIPYAALILTTGSLWEGPLEIPVSSSVIKQHLSWWRNRFEKANSIVLICGGSISAEYTGEIRQFYPATEITIVPGGRLPLNASYPDKFRSRDQITLHADLVVPTRGGWPNTEFIKSSLGESALTATGHVKVLPTFQLPNYPCVFAGGDITDLNEQKQAAKALGHASIIFSNVQLVLEGKTSTKLYKGATEAILITLGMGGISYIGILWGIILGGWFTGFIKSKGLLINMVKGQLGL
ncbi:hypothetical protein FA15DRAFT_717116 [Coprinopsis marcescibilis]|uniref:FAD/NAD(P)-binding domain-containing protein n=1 Tax=Coprinopsis marcescibilis TaxID=230819 RepID=A0A5C3KMC3_COPMA|nr:hypothetical protein FA15DRAFT_717116 [Coprinopsis marcescibilis]